MLPAVISITAIHTSYPVWTGYMCKCVCVCSEHFHHHHHQCKTIIEPFILLDCVKYHYFIKEGTFRKVMGFWLIFVDM